MENTFEVCPVQLRDAKKLSEAEYFLKYQQHPQIILSYAEEQSKDCLSCQ